MVDNTATSDIYPWHESVWQRLISQHSQSRLHHALLLTGHQGIGKRQFGRFFAAFILCQKTAKTEPCGQCKGCLLCQAGTHPDQLILAPEDKSRFIKIDEIRKANTFLTNKAQMNGYKVVLISEANALNINAANALLKNLEEPAPQTLFILISDQPGRIPATIRSRCYKIQLALPADQQIRDWLSLNCPQTLARHDLVIALSDRAPILARQLLEEGGLEARQNVIKGLVMLHKKKLSAIDVAQEWQSMDVVATLDWMLVWINDLIRYAMSRDETAIKNQDMLVFLSKIVHLVLLDELYLTMDRVQKLRQAIIIGHNPNKTLLLERILLDWPNCFRQA